jgi:hypothetical protein
LAISMPRVSIVMKALLPVAGSQPEGGRERSR